MRATACSSGVVPVVKKISQAHLFYHPTQRRVDPFRGIRHRIASDSQLLKVSPSGIYYNIRVAGSQGSPCSFSSLTASPGGLSPEVSDVPHGIKFNRRERFSVKTIKFVVVSRTIN